MCSHDWPRLTVQAPTEFHFGLDDTWDSVSNPVDENGLVRPKRDNVSNGSG
jgi:hypothetical protein